MADESLCRRCCVCCYEKLVVDDTVVVSDIPCPYLDVAEKRCTVYADRALRQARCLSVEEAIAARALAADCPYVRDLPDYRPPVRLRDHPEYLPLVRDELGTPPDAATPAAP